MTTTIFARINVPGFHHWPNAPVARAYLAVPHRHDFVIIGVKQVNHQNRAVEFHDLCQGMQRALVTAYPVRVNFETDFGDHSCEMIAAALLERLNLDACEVSEDGINGAKVMR
jgi:hypothetical protein